MHATFHGFVEIKYKNKFILPMLGFLSYTSLIIYIFKNFEQTPSINSRKIKIKGTKIEVKTSQINKNIKI